MSGEGRARGLLVMLIVWTLVVATVMVLAVGFGGSAEAVFTADNPAAWLVTFSPLIPFVLWLVARR